MDKYDEKLWIFDFPGNFEILFNDIHFKGFPHTEIHVNSLYIDKNLYQLLSHQSPEQKKNFKKHYPKNAIEIKSIFWRAFFTQQLRPRVFPLRLLNFRGKKRNKIFSCSFSKKEEKKPLNNTIWLKATEDSYSDIQFNSFPLQLP